MEFWPQFKSAASQDDGLQAPLLQISNPLQEGSSWIPFSTSHNKEVPFLLCEKCSLGFYGHHLVLETELL